MSIAPINGYTDDDGDPLGYWELQDTEACTSLQAKVYSTLTDPYGNYGTPMIYTEWGDGISPTPDCATVITNTTGAYQDRICTHYRYVVTT